MKALTPQELMIGDLVKFKPQDNPELASVTRVEIGDEDLAFRGCFYPIRISKKILLKIIGFYEFSPNRFELIINQKPKPRRIEIYIDLDNKSCIINNYDVHLKSRKLYRFQGYVKYIHELQQAMRVCKIDPKLIIL